MELEDKVTPLVLNQEDARVLMYHIPASVMIRKEILGSLSDTIRDINQTEV